MNKCLKQGDAIALVYLYDDDTSDTITFDPLILVPDDRDIDQVRDFSIELGGIISYEIRKQKYRPIKEIRIIHQ